MNRSFFILAATGKCVRLLQNQWSRYDSFWNHQVLHKQPSNERNTMNAVTETQDRVSLYYREGSSDKVYQAAIKTSGNRFVVNFAYGRGGSTLATNRHVDGA